MDLSKITNLIFVGGSIIKEDLAVLRDHGINMVVNMMVEDNSEEDFVEDAGLDYQHFPTEDGFPMTLSELVYGSELLVKAIAVDLKKVYIHCAYGVGRSPYMAAAVLMNLGMETYEALNFVASKRMLSRVSPWQEIALSNLERYMQGESPLDQVPSSSEVDKFYKSRASWLKSMGYDVESDELLKKINNLQVQAVS